jgi:ATP:ADP antiporter, AAA family
MPASDPPHRADPPRRGVAARLRRLVDIMAPIRPGEGVTAVLLATNVFILLSCYYILKVVREPLILLSGDDKLGGAELKAYASVGQTLLLLIVVPAFGLLASRVARVRLLTIVNAILVLCLIGFYVLARIHAPIGLAFYLWLGIFSVLVVSNFWSFATDLYTQEQGKRLFAVIGLGGSIGAAVGALLPKPLHELVGTYELMLVAAAGLVVSTVLYRVIDLRERIDRDPRGLVALVKAEAIQPVGREGGFRLVLRDRYLRLVAITVVVALTINTVGEYVVSKLVEDASRGHADRKAFIEGFYSGYYGAVNIASAVIQGLLVSRILAKLGVRKTLFVMPIVALGGWLGFAAFATLGTIQITKTVENSVDYSLHKTVGQALYLPTSRESKYKAKVAIDTFFFRLGDVIAGLGVVLVLVDVLGLGLHALAGINLVLSVIWLGLVWRTGRLHDIRAEERRARAALGIRETAP